MGNDLYKISIRYRELSRFLKKFIRDGTVVLEYGSGSSSILFNSLKRVSKLISIEEEAAFLPTMETRKPWITPKLPTVFHHSKQYKSKVFLNSEPFVSMAQIVYVDGPSNNQNCFFGLAEPNLELILMNNLERKVILVDCRTLTVCELYQKLESSHFFFPSKAAAKEFNDSLLLQETFPNVKHAIASGRKITLDNLGFLPVRTSGFVPKSQPLIITSQHKERKTS